MRYNAQPIQDKRCVLKDISEKISIKLKALRRERGWSLDKTAAETGVSKAMLGQIERGESSPTIATLWKIASGFQISFSSFIEEGPAEYGKPMHRVGVPKQLHPTDTKIRVMPIFSFDKKFGFEVFIIELLPGCEHLSPPHKGGVVEHAIAVEGSLEILVNGEWKALNKGDGLRFEANQPHGYRNRTTKIATFHDIIHYPKG